MAYDLTATISPYLDIHLLFPIFDFLENNKIFNEEDILKTKLKLLSKTNMSDYASSIYKKLHNTDQLPAEKPFNREEVVTTLKAYRTKCGPLYDIVSNEELVKQLQDNKQFTLPYLQEKYNITNEIVEHMYQYAKAHFESGRYDMSSYLLQYYRQLTSNEDKSFQALWGKFASELLLSNWDNAFEDFEALKEAIETKGFTSPLQLLQQRTWLVHWGLFLLKSNSVNHRTVLIDTLITDKYLNAIQLNSPHVIRYITAAIITNKKRRSLLKDFVSIIEQAKHDYSDPITTLVEALFVKFDFEGAQNTLKQCVEVLKTDYFLSDLKSDFIENARLTIFETYCRIHKVIDISTLAEKLNMDSESAERWIVNLIRNARLPAKIDSNKNHVIMGSQYTHVYQQILDKTENYPHKLLGLKNRIGEKKPATVGQANKN